MEFQKWDKIQRLNRDMLVTEKIDGSNAQVYIFNLNPSNNMRKDFERKGWEILKSGLFEYAVVPGSRNRFVTLQKDNMGFAAWVQMNASSLLELGPGRHYGEWWGAGIQRKYGQTEKRFSLFNVHRWGQNRPKCCDVVPVIYEGPFCVDTINFIIEELKETGSYVAPGFMNPEGVVVYHKAANKLFKVTCERDQQPKGGRR